MHKNPKTIWFRAAITRKDHARQMHRVVFTHDVRVLRDCGGVLCKKGHLKGFIQPLSPFSERLNRCLTKQKWQIYSFT